MDIHTGGVNSSSLLDQPSGYTIILVSAFHSPPTGFSGFSILDLYANTVL
nr:MAG TPA: hypothetical protein [Caudoviricetes sp.]